MVRATAAHNHSSLRAFTKVGFRVCGTLTRVGLGPWHTTRYEPHALAVDPLVAPRQAED